MKFYPQFKQVVVFGVRRERSGIASEGIVAYLERIAELGDSFAGYLQEMTRDNGIIDNNNHYTLPQPIVSDEQFVFRGIFVKPETAVQEAQAKGLRHSLAFQRHFVPGNGLYKLEPLTPMKIGHLTGIIAAGHINNQVLEQNGQRLLIKGHSFKKKTEKKEQEKRQDGYVEYTKLTEQVVTTVATLDQDGGLTHHDGPGMQAFLQTWIQPLTEVVAKAYPPRYTFDLNGFGPTLNKLNLGRKIPLVGKPGLLPAQKHASAAAATRLLSHDDAIIVGEMGTGKTLMGTAVPAALLGEGKRMKHMIILCPPHLVKKWIREIKIVWPKAKATALHTISDVDRFFAEPGPIFGVMKETSARSGSGWEHALDFVGPRRLKTRSRKQPVTYLGRKQFPVTDNNAKALTYQMERGIRCPTCGTKQMKGDTMMMVTDLTSAKDVCGNPQCRQPLWQDTRYGEGGKAKYPLATYIKKRYKSQLDMLIADECHQFKGQDSDRGFAFARLCSAARKTLLLTGTIYGGKASTLFYLLYRASAEMRAAYTDRNKQGKKRLMLKEWVQRYGILQEIETASYDENGKMNGNSRDRRRIVELPGGSPAMLPWLLNNAVFVSLPDMGFALPEYEEIPVPVTMTADMRAQYLSLEHQLKEELRKRLLIGDKSLLGAYVQSLLSLPDSPWRPKGVTDSKGKLVAHVKALPDLAGSYPKEREIVQLIREEKAQGRKTLLLCQQTNTLDITPQWVAMLKEAGIKAAVLNVEPGRREKWVKDQVAKGVDVIITHPRRVETGLDLLDFPTIVWMGTEYSIYTILQASRRSWRIGQTEPVKVYFFVYEGTLQEQALKLIAAKAGAAVRVNGDTVQDGNGLAELDELANTDMINALAKMIVGEMDFEAEMKAINEAYEAALAGDLTQSQTYSFADCTDAASIKKRYRQLARQYHPDVAEQAALKVDSLQDAFQQVNEAFRNDATFIGEYDMSETVLDLTTESGDVVEDPPFEPGYEHVVHTAESGDTAVTLESIGDDGELYAYDPDEDAWECVTGPDEDEDYLAEATRIAQDSYTRHVLHAFTEPSGQLKKPERPAVYRNGTSCMAMKEVKVGVWLQCCKQELHRGFCDFSLGPDWKTAAATAESGGAKDSPTSSPKVAVASRPKRLVFGVHDAYGNQLPAERLDKVGVQQLRLFG